MNLIYQFIFLIYFQFNDMLLVCRKVKLTVLAKFKVKREFNLKDVWVCMILLFFRVKVDLDQNLVK